MIYSESPRRKQISEQVSWGHWFALANMLLAIAISSIYMFSTSLSTTPISFVYMVTMWIGHISFLTFIGFVILILPLCYRLTNEGTLKAVSATIAAIGLAFLAFDALIYNQTGFHLSFSSAELLRSETRAQVNAFNWLQWFYFGMLFVIWLMLQLLIANSLHKRLKRLQRFRFTPYVTSFLVVCFVSSHGIHIWADARLYTPVLKQDNMFPLSYPATAKTLMARYGLLDLEMRQQQASLQYQVGSGFRYPPQPVYCSVKSDIKVVVLASLDTGEFGLVDELNKNEFHLVTETEADSFSQQIKYGIPSNMVDLTSVAPVLLDLLSAFDITNTTYITGQNQISFEEFTAEINRNEFGFFFGVLTAEDLSELSKASLGENLQLMVIARPTGSLNYHLYSNFITNTQASTNEDIAPTVLQAFGCMAEVERYSTGQALQSPARNWLVSTNNDNLVIMKYPYITEVGRDGSYKVVDVTSNQEVLVDIDTNMLSRSIKHLESFTE